MPSLLVIRLLPENPVTGDEFTVYLAGLTITAYDSSFAIPFPDNTAPQIGVANYVQPDLTGGWPNNVPNYGASTIVQHFKLLSAGPPLPTFEFTAVATAVIVVPDPVVPGEFLTADPYLIITGTNINTVDPQIYYNIDVSTPAPAPLDPSTFQQLLLTSINLTLSPANGLSGATGLLPVNGAAPNFDVLLAAVTSCMNADPGNINLISALSFDQCVHIASELLWNEKNDPIPLPPNSDSLDDLYTGPIVAGSNQDKDRKQFEGDLQAYYVTRNAKSQKLAEFIFSLSASLFCENLANTATQSGFFFPVLPGKSGTVTAKVILNGPPVVPPAPLLSLVPALSVGAKFFYALTALLPHQINAQQRFQIATLDAAAQVADTINGAFSDRVITPVVGDLTVDQIARRLNALGAAAENGTPVFNVIAGSDAQTLLSDWLAFTGPDINAFWNVLSPADVSGQLDLLLCLVTGMTNALITAIRAPAFAVADANALSLKTNTDWENIFIFAPPNLALTMALLPEFTKPGTPEERVQAFIRNLRKYLVVTVDAPAPIGVSPDDLPGLYRFAGNPVDTLLSIYPGFTFGGWNPGLLAAALVTIFPGDNKMQQEFTNWLGCIKGLITLSNGTGTPEFQFSVMEALWSAGFLSATDVSALSVNDFTTALSGTTAYGQATTIWNNAGGTGPNPDPVPGEFQPINVQGKLVNCIPPPQLSPLGPVAYLHELLIIGQESTCNNPFPKGSKDTLGAALLTRRGPIGSLLATRSNMETLIPMVDIVNESLEFMVSTGADNGAVYNNTNQQDGELLLEAQPEHATPSVPTGQQAAYTILKNDFSDCSLPYAQPLDVNRSYLRHLGTSRFDTMRHFRKQITEFVLDPSNQPVGFQDWLWRYPVRIETAMEYLCITPEEYEILFQPGDPEGNTPLGGGQTLSGLYGYPANPDNAEKKGVWFERIAFLSEFLKRTCLSYCDFVSLWKCGFVKFGIKDQPNFVFPECEPCCLDKYTLVFTDPEDTELALLKLIIFIRLWRKMNDCKCGKDCRCGTICHCRHYNFDELCDICDVLQLFKGPAVNPDFVRQMAAFQMLRDDFNLPLKRHNSIAEGATGVQRTQLLALWAPGAPTDLFNWAVSLILDRMYDFAVLHHNCNRRREPEFLKILETNLDSLSDLAGFDHHVTTNCWQALPSHTLRFAEVLAKIYASHFSIGELLFLFTSQEHLDGDDVFPLQTNNEAQDEPIELPEEDKHFSLWALRKKLLDIRPEEERDSLWTWNRITDAMRERFGYNPAAGVDHLLELGQHFFPGILEREGFVAITPAERRFSTGLALADTSAGLWTNAPFHYDIVQAKLWVTMPLPDHTVINKLNEIRQLSPVEQAAVQELYFLPRAALAPFAFLFPDFTYAESRMIEEQGEIERWEYFRAQFAQAYERSQLIANHLTEHVIATSDRYNQDQAGQGIDSSAAHVILRHLLADENKSLTPWENDNGQPPVVTWPASSSGGSYAALLGLAGRGLMGSYKGQDAALRWQEIRGKTEAFGRQDDRGQAQIPTLLPSMKLVFTPEQLRFAMVRNGFASGDRDGERLGGAEGFSISWKGVLIIDLEGEYNFMAGHPTPEGEHPDFEKIARSYQWKVKLQRGQKKYILLDHHKHAEPPQHDSGSIFLKRGAYRLTIDLFRKPFGFSFREEACPEFSGFQVKYNGPDTGGCKKTMPVEKLFTEEKNDTLAAGITFPVGANNIPSPSAAENFLLTFYESTIRDIRRTYQRAFKSLLFTQRFKLSGDSGTHFHHSEIGYMLSQPDLFTGQSYYTNGGIFTTHRAGFDFNFLPVDDNYSSPTTAQDDRTAPSPQRTQAMFDWWERVFDYCIVKKQVGHRPEHPLWLLFYHAGQPAEDIAEELVRHLGIDTRHDELLLKYYDNAAADKLFNIRLPELRDDRWTVRVWHCEQWIRHLRKNFHEKDITQAAPYTWASDDPITATAAGLLSGNENLVQFYIDGSINNGEIKRYLEIKKLNDGLRERGRKALIAYLTHMNRTALPFGGFVENARQLSELLLLDVETGICEKASRVDELITSIQLFIMRARIGLEPAFTLTSAFIKVWDQQFADFRIWEACERKTIYKENWIDCEILGKDQHTQAFQFLASELRSSNLTVPVPGGLAWWQGSRPPIHPGIELLQDRNASVIQIAQPAFEEGTDLMGTPDYHARRSWLAPFVNQAPAPVQGNGGTNEPDIPNNQPGNLAVVLDEVRPNIANQAVATSNAVLPANTSTENLPLWFQAAVRLGTQFVRVAAAGIPPASTSFKAQCDTNGDGGCCCHCGKKHPALIDEYYFWLEDSRYYDKQDQNADQGAVTGDPTVDWDRDDKLPELLLWPSKPTVHLRWCRVHNGLFEEANQSFEALMVLDPMSVDPPAYPGLVFLGRIEDSLNFSVTNGLLTFPPTAYPAASPPPGFRYDLASDQAVIIPLIAPPPVSALIGGLTSFPFFAWYMKGAPVIPLSMYGTAILVAGHLRAHCHFEAALKWYELVYNPLLNDNRWMICSGQPVNNDGNNPNDNQLGDVGPGINIRDHGDQGNPGANDQDPVGDCCCASDPVPVHQVKNRAILMLYLETLIQWGDTLMREKKPESFQKARLIFDTIEKISGNVPITIFAQADPSKALSITDFLPACAPVNPRLMCLYMKMRDRIELIHHCIDLRKLRNGRPGRDMFYFGDSEVRDCWKMGNDLCCNDDDLCAPQSPYRFLVLIQKASEAAADLRSLGANLLSAYEKGDTEYLGTLKTEQERQIASLSIEISQNQWRDADWQLQALQKTKEISQTRLQYYNGLITTGLTPGESEYEPLTVTSSSIRTAGNISVAVGQIMNIIPDSYVGENNFVKLPIGSKLAAIFGAAGTIASTAAEIVNTIASLGLTKDGWDRRLAEWQYEVSVLTVEIEQIERQILGAERRKDIALRQLNNQQQQLENVNEVHGFIRDKFTGHAFYLWLQQETSALHFQMYEITVQYAQLAQRAFNFERGHTAREFLPHKIWQNLYEGLLCGEHLYNALRHMEKAYYEENRREYELTKHVSCRQNFSKAFLQLQTLGYAEIELPEWMFDMDYPGQYMRRIRNVSMTLPCVAGPYTGIHCRLTLLSSTTRVNPSLWKPVHLCCDKRRCNNGYESQPGDPRMVHLYAATEAIATSSGMNESGTFEVNFRDDRYLPFEFMGAVSRWRIELPIENNYFQMKTLSDLVLHINYTSREGGDLLRKAALECSGKRLPGDGIRFFDVRRELSDAWQLLVAARKDCELSKKLAVKLSRQMFPFLPNGRKIVLGGIEIMFEAPCADPNTHHLLEFMPGKRHEEVKEGWCGCDERLVLCIAEEKWPGLFHGIIDFDPVELGNGQPCDIGVFRFPKEIQDIGEVYLFCNFQELILKQCIC